MPSMTDMAILQYLGAILPAYYVDLYEKIGCGWQYSGEF
jgi:hypothetical protein